MVAISKPQVSAVGKRFGLGISLICLLMAAPASAASPRPMPDFSLSVSPTRLVVSGDGLRQVQHLQVTNYGRTPVTVDVTKQGFAQLADGTVKFEHDAPYSAVEWVTATPTHFHLDPQAARDIAVRIAVPSQADPGEHQMVLVSSVAAPSGGPNLRINRGVGVAVYVQVPGESDDDVRLNSFTAPGLVFSGPVQLSASVTDAGTVHHDFNGPDRLMVRAGGRQIMFPGFVLLRGSTRVVTTEWKDPPLFCDCNTTLTFVGAHGALLHRTVNVTVVPVPLLAGLAGGLAAAAGGTWWLRRRRRRRA